MYVVEHGARRIVFRTWGQAYKYTQKYGGWIL